MKTLGEYVMMPSRPASTRPRSRSPAAMIMSSSKASPRADRSQVASSGDNATPRRARASARMTPDGVRGTMSLYVHVRG